MMWTVLLLLDVDLLDQRGVAAPQLGPGSLAGLVGHSSSSLC